MMDNHSSGECIALYSFEETFALIGFSKTLDIYTSIFVLVPRSTVINGLEKYSHEQYMYSYNCTSAMCAQVLLGLSCAQERLVVCLPFVGFCSFTRSSVTFRVSSASRLCCSSGLRFSVSSSLYIVCVLHVINLQPLHNACCV